MSRFPVAVLGATGVAGRQALRVLARHPWFEIAAVASSTGSAGRRLGDVLDERAASSLCYTSGTTGNPKGVLFSHRSTVLHTYAAALPDSLSCSARDVSPPAGWRARRTWPWARGRRSSPAPPRERSSA